MTQQKLSNWLPALAGVVLIGLLTFMRSSDPALIASLRGSGFDTLQRIWPREMSEAQPVRIIDIDEASLGEVGQWPWPRSTLAALTNELIDLGAAAVAFDIVFPEPDRMSPRKVLATPEAQEALKAASATLDPTTLPDNDETFATAIRGRPVVLAFASSGGSRTKAPPLKAGFAQTGEDALDAAPRLLAITTNLPILDAAAAGVGSMNISLATDEGVARQIPFLLGDGERLYPSLAAETLRVAQGAETLLVHASPDTRNAIESLVVGDLEVPLSESGQFYVYYRPDPRDLYVPAARVLSGKERDALRPLIEGHVVFVGTSAVGLLDVRTSALGETVPGVSVHAQAIEQVLSGTFLTRPEWAAGAEILGVIVVGIALAAFTGFVRPRTSIIACALLAVAIIAGVLLAFRSGSLLLDATYPLIALTLTFLGSIALKLMVTDRHGRQLRGAFAQYVAPAVLAEIENNPASLKLGGEMRDVTVLFVDIENFTPLSEKLDPVSLVKVVNRLLDAGSKAILAEKGTIDKYIGDAIMAFWNAPIPLENHQYHAARAAIGIRKAVAALNDDPDLHALLTERGAPRLAVRVGLASGPACVGNMGSAERFDYSVLGETVNTAARTEATCKALGFDIAVAGTLNGKTAELAWLYAGSLPMKGKSRAEPVHIIVDDEAHGASPEFQKFRKTYNELVERLDKSGSKKQSDMIRMLFDELSAQHPALAHYFETVLKRPGDFARPA
ncbi:MAG: adenylate/guanylate cyclase domain-containing protein [Rhizobiales bacterium]|nr:adenylate/guanylate cyclase domain-containing protein [Hyphomicrobiales bacterium]